MTDTALADTILNFRFGACDQGFESRPVNAQGGDETCHVLPNADGTYSIQSPNGQQWLSIQSDGSRQARQVSDPSQPGSWERFTRNGNVLTELPKDGTSRQLVQFLVKDVAAQIGQPFDELHTDGLDIKHADGSRYVHKQATNYLLFQRHGFGQNITSLLYDGFDGYNVTFLMSVVPKQAGLPDLTPKDDPQFFNKAGDFLTFMRDKRKRIEGTLICDNNVFGYDETWLKSYCEQMYDLFRAFNVNLVQLANEGQKNGVRVENFAQPKGLMWSRGSSLSGDSCPLPAGTHSTAHLARQGGGAWLDAQPYYMVNGYAGYAGTHGPVITNETRGASNTVNSDSRTTDPNYFRQISSAMKGWSGGTWHADVGIHSEALQSGTQQDECRKAFLEGIGA